MKRGFYPYSGPAGKDDPSRPYPRWYYPDADGTAFIVHNVQEYITAIDFFYRSVFGNSENTLWFIGLTTDIPTLLPQVLSSGNPFDETADISNFVAGIGAGRAYAYPEVLLQMAFHNIPTRLLEWSTNSIKALHDALSNTNSNLPATVFALDPLGLNRAASIEMSDSLHVPEALRAAAEKLSDALHAPEALSAEIAPLFGSSDRTSAGANSPFAVTAMDNNGKKRMFTVAPNSPQALAIERIPNSARYLFKIQVPSELRTLLLRQLQRVGLL
ncbi:hypothetical protein CCDG5_1701 [[Clostridium] cellulosi]|uniref:Uncharacterized protein n=1 Tax=[Clostridium] cellulosi TaxID=29343 RepID=A0A078KUM7_9FIRM|nr:hypothetical protein CCDG5_1701 [[Clostridium] cellulosi]